MKPTVTHCQNNLGIVARKAMLNWADCSAVNIATNIYKTFEGGADFKATFIFRYFTAVFFPSSPVPAPRS